MSEVEELEAGSGQGVGKPEAWRWGPRYSPDTPRDRGGKMRDQPWFADQSVAIGRVGSGAHSNSEPSYTATFVTPNNVSTNATLHAAMAPPQ